MMWVTPSPESTTVPVNPFFCCDSIPNVAQIERTACTAIKIPFTLNVSNITSARYSLFSGVFRGGSV
jgi:hypothetical protein